MKHCLFILPGPVPPDTHSANSRFTFLSKVISGAIVQSSWSTQPCAESNFSLHLHRYISKPWLVRFLWDLLLIISKGTYLHYARGPFSAVVCYGTTKTALAGYIIKLLTGAKLIIEIPGNPRQAFMDNNKPFSVLSKIRNACVQRFINFWLRHADGIHTYYKKQLDGYKVTSHIIIKTFPEFVAVSALRKKLAAGKLIMFLGYPWYLKGLDVLLQAYVLINKEFPEYQLLVMGHIQADEKDYLRRKFCPQIAGLTFVPGSCWAEAMHQLSEAAFLVLPSRSEAMGRVWAEAMAMGKPVICSNVDGIPDYVTNNENGILFDSENVSQLAADMKRLITDQTLYMRLSENGYRYAHEILSEQNYVSAFVSLVDEVCHER
ncbi:MAG: glycosyltransferase family 4 protein [Deltaproteobacteria bacterium]|nr:glycosyltransferase family 4 protein [Deltaproteobacteria bacterium]